MLAAHGDGCTDSLMRAHGFQRDVIAELILAGLAAAAIERTTAGAQSVGVRRIKITDAGRRQLSNR